MNEIFLSILKLKCQLVNANTKTGLQDSFDSSFMVRHEMNGEVYSHFTKAQRHSHLILKLFHLHVCNVRKRVIFHQLLKHTRLFAQSVVEQSG